MSENGHLPNSYIYFYMRLPWGQAEEIRSLKTAESPKSANRLSGV